MVMDCRKRTYGIMIAQSLSMPITLGSYEETSIAVGLMRVHSSLATALALVAPTTVFVLYFFQLERKRLTLLKVVMNRDE